MLAKIYVVSASQGEYSDYSNEAICATSSKERAKELVDKLTRLTAFNDAFDGKERTEFIRAYERDHSVVVPPYPEVSKELRAIELKVASKKCTPRDKVIHKRLQEMHLQRVEEHKVAVEKWNAARAEMKLAEAKWVKENYHPPADLEEVMPYCPIDAPYYSANYDFDELDLL